MITLEVVSLYSPVYVIFLNVHYEIHSLRFYCMHTGITTSCCPDLTEMSGTLTYPIPDSGARSDNRKRDVNK